MIKFQNKTAKNNNKSYNYNDHVGYCNEWGLKKKKLQLPISSII
jgi:hypothetical protein